MGLAIVAIPEEEDRVWKISSEKVPHMTLLFLGEAASADTQQIMQFVQHAVTLSEHGPFYLDVDRRGTLGDDEADVLFFSKRSWNLKWIKQLRGQLLQNGAVRAAYDSTQQFPEWLPHLTLGYPQAPAKPLPENDGWGQQLYSVAFNRIAVWESDAEGPEFRLEWPEREFEGDLAIAYSETQKAALLHYGVKGMKWGHIRENNARRQARDLTKRAEKLERPTASLGTKLAFGPKIVRDAQARQDRATAAKFEKQANKLATKREKKADSKWEKTTFTPETWVQVHNAGADHVNAKIEGINSSFSKKHPKEMSDGTLFNESHPVTREYTAAYHKELVTGLNQGAAKLPKSPSGKYRVKVVSKNHDSLSEFSWSLDAEKVEHAATSQDLEFIFVADRDSNGLITKFTPEVEEEETLEQAATLGEQFLEHFGVKGMKWGQRKARIDRKGGRDPKRLAILRNKAKSPFKKVGRGIKRAVESLDEHFYETSIYSRDTHEAIHNQVAGEIDHKVFQLGSTPKYREKNLRADKALKDEYEQDVAKVTDAAYRRAVKDHVGENTKGTKRARYIDDARGTRIEIVDKATKQTVRGTKLKSADEIRREKTDEMLEEILRPQGARHAATDPEEAPDIVIPVKLDSNGQIKAVGYVKPGSTAEHGEAFVEGLMHFGVKGMRWGIRRNRSTPLPVSTEAASRVPHGKKRKTKIEVEGGENHPASVDALKVAQAKAKLKRSGTSALTNQELREVADRIRLEEQVKVLTSSKGKKFVLKELEGEGKNLAKKGAKKGAKKAAVKVGSAALLA